MKSDSMNSFKLIFRFATLIGLEYVIYVKCCSIELLCETWIPRVSRELY